MKRLLATVSALALLFSATGCCHHLCGRSCAPPPCGPCGSNYGGAPAYSQAYVQPAYATASLPGAGFVSANAPAAGCNCGPSVAPY